MIAQPELALVCWSERPSAPLRLICLPCAGSAAAAFQPWDALLSLPIELSAVELPGHGSLFGSGFASSFDAVVEALIALLAKDPRPYVLLGHSLGGLLAYEAARRLRSAGPARLMIAALACPVTFPGPAPALSRLPPDAFIAHVRELGGLPEVLLAQPDLCRRLLPVLQADAALFETYRYQPEPLLGCPLDVFGGRGDAIASLEQLERWRDLTSASFSLHVIGSGHFFLHSQRERTVARVERELRPLLAADRARPHAAAGVRPLPHT